MELSFRERASIVRLYDHDFRVMVEAGWKASFVTFKFHRIAGGTAHRQQVMQDEVMRVFSTLITHVNRNPHRESQLNYLPIAIGTVDWPIYKREKELLRDVIVNEGMHFHLVILLPPKDLRRKSFQKSLRAHFRDEQHRYYLADHPLDFIHVQPIKQGTMVDYALKSFKKGRVTSDDILVLPRARSELRNS